MSAKIIGCGAFLPNKVVFNDEFEKFLDTSHEWIRSRTGITQRHFADSNQSCSDLAIHSSLNAIADASISKHDIDLIICATTTADNTFPSLATKIQKALSVQNIPAFDIQAVCSGFIYGLHIADCLISSGKHSTILLTCSEKMSNLLDMSDRGTCILFGDGAGSVVLQKNNGSKFGILDTQIYSDGSGYELLYTDGGVSTNQHTGFIRMNGKQVFRHAVEKMSEVASQILHKNNMTINDVKYFIPHQANARILEAVANQLGCDRSKLIITVDKHANCSAASIPLALNDLKKSDSLQNGDIILFVALGAGFTWGASLVSWG
jgi:3-oxoacyl-[acyl-carrier-protein] synthase-3